jgi:Zn finger protein HypA/HybF involved in hydrogenase expression
MPIADLTKEELALYAKESNNWKELMTKCGYTNYGCRYYLKRKLTTYDISIDHFIKQTSLRHYTTEETFKENSENTNSKPIKNKLIREFGWKYECSGCKISTWLGKPISLELDHINGVHNDNRIENLRFLCPNCHSQTDTYRGRNVKNKKHSEEIYNNIKNREVCPACGNKKNKVSENCIDCHLQKLHTNELRKNKKCMDCDNTIQKDSNRCMNCYKQAKRNGIIKRKPKKLLTDNKE